MPTGRIHLKKLVHSVSMNPQFSPQTSCWGENYTWCRWTIANQCEGILLRLNLSLANCRRQRYDGVENMADIRTVLATLISEYEQRAIFTHCYGHTLNLAAADAMQQSKVLCCALDIVGEMSWPCDTLFESIKSDTTPGVPGFQTLCPTRWTTKAASLQVLLIIILLFGALGWS